MLFDLFSDPFNFLRSLLILLPGALLSLSMHEAAHGLIAEKCGDPTARYAGRITLNPLKHFDLFGFLCMLVIGFGWAKPVPVNPLLYKNWRRDDIKVSLAGITANLLLALVCFLIITTVFNCALAALPTVTTYADMVQLEEDQPFLTSMNGNVFYWFSAKEGYISNEDLFRFSFGRVYYIGAAGDLTVYNSVIEPAFGPIVSILYEIISRCMYLNIALAVFNLIPLPPLDGYHVLNDLVLKQDLFAQQKTVRIAGGILVALILIGNYKPEWDIISIGINGVATFFTNIFAAASQWIAGVFGVI